MEEIKNLSLGQHASINEKIWIQKILAVMLKTAKILKWEATEKPQEYQIELAQEVLGNHPEIPLGQLILKKKIKIAFLEEKIPETNRYRQIVIFPEKGVCFRVGIGWLSKESPLERLLIEEDLQKEIWCTIEGMGQKIVKPADFTLEFWKKMQWT